MLIPLAYAAEAAAKESSGVASIVEYIVTQLPLWIAAILVFVLSVFIAKIIKRSVENKIAEKGIEEEHKGIQALGGRVANAGVLTLGVTAALKIAGIDITAIIAAGAFGIGFALRDLIMNFLAGVMILVSRHFTIDDFIKINDTVGKIVEIQSRATVIQALDGTKVIVPNAELFTNIVTSFTSNPFRRIEVIVGVDYGTNLKFAIEKCNEAIKATKGVLAQPKPMVILDEFADSSINLIVRAWVESRSGWLVIRSDLIASIKAEFDKANINIPWPIRTIYYGKDMNADTEKALESQIAETQILAQVPAQPQPQEQEQGT
ncbi:MAG: mechanosensitive ion channel family protein [Nitrospirota bacterium]|nr:mechanosensitive ion channel family protein [Patescibacteria group bacterium]